MKRIFSIFITLMFFKILAISQTYEPFITETKQWKYVEKYYLTEDSSQPIYFVTIGYFSEDTLIENDTYKKFYHKTIIYDTTTTIAYLFSEDTINHQVYVHDPIFNKTELLYDFSISEEDSFNRYILHDTYMKLKVTKVDTLITFNKKLKRIMFNDSTTWIESIGDITYTKIPSYGDLICVKDDGYLLYLNNKYNNCDTIFPRGPYDVINEIKHNSNINIFPNPIERTSILEVESNLESTFKIEIYNIFGIRVKSDSFKDIYLIGDLILPKGFYVIQVLSKNKIIGSVKIVIK